MSDQPSIPYGYRAVQGQLQKGDGLWDGTRFRKVKKGYPFLGTVEGVAIRRCVVTQEPLSLGPTPADQAKAHQYLYYVLAKPVWSDHQYDLFCKEHGIDGGGGSDRPQDYSPGVIRLAEELVRQADIFDA